MYFVGRNRGKISAGFNSDDDTHNAQLIPGDHLAYPFEVAGLLGSGSFGRAFRCLDHKTKSEVACKVIVNTDQMHEQGAVEAQIVATLNRARWRCVVRGHDFFIFRGHICITFEIIDRRE
jgi:dual specificity tyrosine-phosphorylation-regulated kinase 2/3/4